MTQKSLETETAQQLLEAIRQTAESIPAIQIMEVCGTHTMAVGRFGIRRLLPENVQLISGPGCPVCVTPADYLDNACMLALEKGIAIRTYGDLIRVPGLKTSLEKARTAGGDIKILTSPLDFLEEEKEAVFLATGFETTIAPLAAIFKQMVEAKKAHLSFYTSFKTVPKTLRLLLDSSETQLGGFLLPGHVSAIIGANAYAGLPIPSAIAGFELNDILAALLVILRMERDGVNYTVNMYPRVVPPEGNLEALKLMDQYLAVSNAPWRGLGSLPGCSLAIRPEWSEYDAEVKYNLPPLSAETAKGCACGKVLQGTITPNQCPLFAKTCTPEMPHGPCMVSSEGSCAAYYKYERIH